MVGRRWNHGPCSLLYAANVLVIVPARFWGTKPPSFCGQVGMLCGILQDVPKPLLYP